MEQGFWQERWGAGAIGFHKEAVHDLLAAHHDAVLGDKSRIYVPLCGKSVDLTYLRDRRHDVVGSEFVGAAIDAFFREQLPDVERRSMRAGALGIHEAQGIRIVQGDALTLDTFATGGLVDGIWDRAALVALDPATRPRYRDALLRVLAPGGAILLVTFVYDQTKLAGPPWSVNDDDVNALFGASCSVEHLVDRAEVAGPKFHEAGVSEVRERLFVLRRR